MLTISLFISLFILAKAFQLIYFFQIKEYRFDRFFSFIKEEESSCSPMKMKLRKF